MTVQANSLLYAIYICLIVALLCGALLYMSGLYTQLNIYYDNREGLYLQNQSAVNFALAHMPESKAPEIDDTGIETTTSIKQFGLLHLLTVQSVKGNDTVTSVHFAGQKRNSTTCLYLTNFDKPLSYDGNVTLKGTAILPSEFIKRVFIGNKPGKLTLSEPVKQSEKKLPEINPQISSLFSLHSEPTAFNSVQKHKDSIYFHTFTKPAKYIDSPKVLNGVVVKGNFIFRSKDSLIIKYSSQLEDVIVIAPVVKIESGFNGNIQIFATKEIILEENVTLNYPSAVCLYNKSDVDKTKIEVGNNSKIHGGIIMYGFHDHAMDKNCIEINEGTFITGDIYCKGKLILKGKVSGTVYTNRFSYNLGASAYDNAIADIDIDATNIPNGYVGLPLFKTSNRYGIIKKVL